MFSTFDLIKTNNNPHLHELILQLCKEFTSDKLEQFICQLVDKNNKDYTWIHYLIFLIWPGYSPWKSKIPFFRLASQSTLVKIVKTVSFSVATGDIRFVWNPRGFTNINPDDLYGFVGEFNNYASFTNRDWHNNYAVNVKGLRLVAAECHLYTDKSTTMQVGVGLNRHYWYNNTLWDVFTQRTLAKDAYRNDIHAAKDTYTGNLGEGVRFVYTPLDETDFALSQYIPQSAVSGDNKCWVINQWEGYISGATILDTIYMTDQRYFEVIHDEAISDEYVFVNEEQDMEMNPKHTTNKMIEKAKTFKLATSLSSCDNIDFNSILKEISC